MAIPELKESLTENFLALPEAIQNWLASTQAMILISDINKKLGLKGEKRSIIPKLLMRLILKDLEPADFIIELGRALNMNFQAAKALTQELEQKILSPIAAGLKQETGLDIKLIYLGESKLKEMPAPLPASPAGGSTAEIPTSPLGKPAPEKPIAPPPLMPPRPITGEAPTVVYKKGTFGRVPIIPPLPPIKPQPIAEPEIPTPITPKVVPPPPIPPKATQIVQLQATSYKLQAEPRVVHYSNFYTPLNSLDLEKTPAANKGEPRPERREPKKEDIILDGNTVDLRTTFG